MTYIHNLITSLLAWTLASFHVKSHLERFGPGDEDGVTLSCRRSGEQDNQTNSQIKII